MAWNRESVATLLKEAAAGGATEVHFKVPGRPLLRAPHGALLPAQAAPLAPADAAAVIVALGQIGGVELATATLRDTEFSFGVPGSGRFRASVYRQRGTLSAIVRCVRSNPPTLAGLGAPPEIDAAIGRPGLLLLCGARRHDLLAASVAAYNARERGHAVVIETTVTALHRDAMANVAQREVGVDVDSHAAGVLGAIRIGADLVACDDIPDGATADALLGAAERGIPVIAAVAAAEPRDATWWLLRTLSGEARQDAERRLERVLRAVLALPRTGELALANPEMVLDLPA
jgi:twitching motility protein PilT